MTKVSDNPYPSLLIVEGAAPAAPAAGQRRLFIDTADHLAKLRGSSGSPVALGAISVPAGGSTGEVLAKASGTDYDTEWIAAPGGGSANLNAFRLGAGVSDDGSIATDEFEYDDATSLDAVWSAASTTMRPAGSEAVVRLQAEGDGIYLDASAFDAAFEVAFLVSGHGHEGNGGMVGIQLTDAAGLGIAMTPYNDANSYLWEVGSVTPHVYDSTGPTDAVAYSAWEDGRPVWFAVKYAAGAWRLRRSENGSAWTTLVAAASRSAVASLARCGFFRAFSSGHEEQLSVHAYAYGTPDLGL